MNKILFLLLTLSISLFAKTLVGVVVDSYTGRPLAHAKVTSELGTTLTRRDGTFRISAVSNKLSFRAKNYKRKTVRFVDGSVVRLKRFKTRALYVSMDAIKNKRKLRQILNIAARTKINTLVIDVKIAKGYLTFRGHNGLAKSIGAYRYATKINPRKFVRFLKQHGVYLIARFPVFKDDLLGRKRPSLAVKRRGVVFRDRDKLRWVNPFNRFVQNYNINLVREIASYGFDEIQFDYIRFPAKNGLNFGHKNNQHERVKALNRFLAKAKHILTPYNVFLAIDTFGAACWTNYDVGIGHNHKKLKKHVDYISPMLYPSGFTYGIPGQRNPVANSYNIIRRSIKSSMRKHGLKAKDFKPWLQAFNDYSFRRKKFGQKELNDQIRACDELGTAGWLLWNASCNYTKYFPHYRSHKLKKR